jgi:RNA polymerase sigma-70 factor, ECF subfamily
MLVGPKPELSPRPGDSEGNPRASQSSNVHGSSTTSHADDFALVQRVRAHESGAYDVLVQRYGDRLYAMLINMTGGDGDMAAELCQEAFVRAYTSLHQFAGKSSFYTWLYRLARNRTLDILAKKKPEARELHLLDRDDRSASPADKVADEELRGQVTTALALLPADQRELLLLREYEGLDYQQIADLLEIPEGTVKSRLNRARSALREQLSGHVVAEDL